MDALDDWSALLNSDIVQLSRLIDGTYPDMPLELADRRRMDKLAEEVGEVSEAYGLFVGENPRKPRNDDGLPDVMDEVLDVALAALAFWAHLYDSYGAGTTPRVITALRSHTLAKLARLEVALADQEDANADPR